MSRVREERDFPLRPRGWEREERAGGQCARARCARFAPATAGVVWCVRGRYLFVPVAMLGGARGGPFMAVCGPFAWLSARVTPRE